jgi:hypothetical protein
VQTTNQLKIYVGCQYSQHHQDQEVYNCKANYLLIDPGQLDLYHPVRFIPAHGVAAFIRI